VAETLLAEFGDDAALAKAIERVRELGVRKLDAHTPYSTELVRDALGAPPSRLSAAVLAGAVLGAAAAYALEWYLVAHLYPLNVGGRPPHFPLAFVPITFEMGVLFASGTAFAGALFLGRLVRLWAPVFEIPGFERASRDTFWLTLELEPGSAEAASFERMSAELGALGALSVRELPGGDP
jgi:hypothetical protein